MKCKYFRSYTQKDGMLILMKEKRFTKWKVYKYLSDGLQYAGQCLFARNIKKFIK